LIRTLGPLARGHWFGVGGSVGSMSYLVGASRTQLIRLQHLEPGTRVQASERVPSGPCHAVVGIDATVGLCGAEVIAVLDEPFSAGSERRTCAECEELVGQE